VVADTARSRSAALTNDARCREYLQKLITIVVVQTVHQFCNASSYAPLFVSGFDYAWKPALLSILAVVMPHSAAPSVMVVGLSIHSAPHTWWRLLFASTGFLQGLSDTGIHSPDSLPMARCGLHVGQHTQPHMAVTS
jgi:hypothetical protein